MKKIQLITIFLLFVFITNGQPPLEYERVNIIHGPYLQNMSENSVTILFTTNKISVPWVMLKKNDGEEIRVQNSEHGLFNAGEVHKILVTDLEPGTTYQYTVCYTEILKFNPYYVYFGDTARTEVKSFSTFSDKKGSIKISIMNDLHERPDILGKLLRKAEQDKNDFFVYNGDMLNYLVDEKQVYDAVIDTSTAIFAQSKPFFWVRGNHETRGYLARELSKFVALKNNRYYYAFDHGPAHFIVLDSGEDKTDDSRYYYNLVKFDEYRLEQTKWLENHIQSKEFKKARIKIVFSHMPISENSTRHGTKFITDNWGPILKKAGIDLLICGHTHRYKLREETPWGFPILIIGKNQVATLDISESKIDGYLYKIDEKDPVKIFSYDAK